MRALTRIQRKVLECLSSGWLMLPAGKVEMGGCVYGGPKGTTPFTVQGRTVSNLFSEGLINMNCGFWEITKDGVKAITEPAS